MKAYVLVFIIIFLLVVLTCCNFINLEGKRAEEAIAMQEEMNTTESVVKVGDSIYTIKEKYKDSLLVDQYSCTVWETPDGYYIACISKDGQTIKGFAQFSKELELLAANGIKPIEEFSQNEWLGKTELEFVSQYGPYHFDFGSGLYTPAYISKTGIIYFLSVDNGTITSISTFLLNEQSSTPIILN